MHTTILDFDTAIRRRRERRVLVSRMNNYSKHLAVVCALARHTFRRTGESIDAVAWPEGPVTVVGATGPQHCTDHAGGDQRAKRKEPGRHARAAESPAFAVVAPTGEEEGLTGTDPRLHRLSVLLRMAPGSYGVRDTFSLPPHRRPLCGEISLDPRFCSSSSATGAV